MFASMAGFSPDVVWLMSYSVEANDLAAQELDVVKDELRRPVTFERTAFGGQHPRYRDVGSVPTNSRLCSVVLVLERSGLSDNAYRHWAEWCINEVACRYTFRLFVRLQDLARGEFEQLAAPGGDKLIGKLKDTVQVTEADGFGILRTHLARYLDRLDDIREIALRRRLSRITALALGRIATIVQAVCILAVWGDTKTDPLDDTKTDPLLDTC